MSKEIHTKSIQLPREDKDGIRTCVMRRIKPEFDFDIWIPHLAPSTSLLSDYHMQKVSWEEYEERFKKEVLDNNKDYLEIVLDISKKHAVTLLCWEETPEKCHRRLVAERLKEMNPKLMIQVE
ncbi:DUF488 family protein [Patescibacteria group bacterium]|nr:DUF488 family protein [Patescibacteria group bacterium]